MRSVKITIWVMVMVCFVCVAQGVVYFNDGGTHEISYQINDDVYVQDGSEHKQTSVTIVQGGLIVGNFETYDSSVITMVDGWVTQAFRTSGPTQTTISGGYIDNGLYANDHSTVTLDGGCVTDTVSADAWSKIYIYGGFTEGMLTSREGSEIFIYGTGFNYSIGPITDVSGALTGTLANGELFDYYFNREETASIILIPEPATLSLLGLGAVMLRRKRS